MKRITVVANCQCLPIARTIEQCCTQVSTDFVDINFINEASYKSKLDDLIIDDGKRIVLSVFLGDEWNGVNTSMLRNIYGDRFRTFTNIHFSGLHPDITYVGSMGSRVTSPLGDYHSKIVLHSFVEGKSSHDCLNMFRTSIFEKIGFFDSYDQASQELLLRDQRCDIAFASRLTELGKQRLPMLTVNHPTSFIFRELVKLISEEIKIDFFPLEIEQITNGLTENNIWPVYGEVAEYHGLPYRTPQIFIRPTGSKLRAILLEDFVKISYSSYEKLPLDKLKGAVENLPFYKLFQELT